MAEDRDEVWRQLSDLKSSVRLLETKVDGKVEALAPREWVHQLMQPIQQSITRMEASVSQLTTDAKDLFDAHSAMLTEKGARERQEWAERTPLGLVKKYAPVIAFLVACVALFRVLGSLADYWLAAHK